MGPRRDPRRRSRQPSLEAGERGAPQSRHCLWGCDGRTQGQTGPVKINKIIF